MLTKISAHLAVTAGLPVLMLALIAAIVSVELGTVNSSQQTVFALGTTQRAAESAAGRSVTFAGTALFAMLA